MGTFRNLESGPVPQTPSPGPTPAEEPNPPPAEALNVHALSYVKGLIEALDPHGYTEGRQAVLWLMAEVERLKRPTLDPRVTFSADWQQFDKLADRLSAMSAAVTVLHQDAEHLARHDVEGLKTRLAELNTEIDAAIRNAQTLGLPF